MGRGEVDKFEKRGTKAGGRLRYVLRFGAAFYLELGPGLFIFIYSILTPTQILSSANCT